MRNLTGKILHFLVVFLVMLTPNALAIGFIAVLLLITTDGPLDVAVLCFVLAVSTSITTWMFSKSSYAERVSAFWRFMKITGISGFGALMGASSWLIVNAVYLWIIDRLGHGQAFNYKFEMFAETLCIFSGLMTGLCCGIYFEFFSQRRTFVQYVSQPCSD